MSRSSIERPVAEQIAKPNHVKNTKQEDKVRSAFHFDTHFDTE